MKTWWSVKPSPGNLGDVLTPVILRKLGIPVRWAPLHQAELIGIGSTLRFVTKDHTVLGTGAMWAHDRPSPNARYLAVRGPLSRDIVLQAGGDCPAVFGDLALLLPRIHDGPIEKTCHIGVVPHYVDTEAARHTYPDAHLIPPLAADPLSVVDAIRQCRLILSSSLHGLIVAHAYGIPAAWVRLSDKLDGDDTKFHDYGASVGLHVHPDMEPAVGTFDTGPLLEAVETLRAN